MKRRDFFSLSATTVIGIPGLSRLPLPHDDVDRQYLENDLDDPISIADIAAAERISGLSFTDAQRELMLPDLQDRQEEFAALRAMHLPNDLAPALHFDPRVGGMHLPTGRRLPTLPPAAAPTLDTSSTSSGSPAQASFRMAAMCSFFSKPRKSLPSSAGIPSCFIPSRTRRNKPGRSSVRWFRS